MVAVSKDELDEGFTPRVLIGIIYTVIVFTPPMIWSQLALGGLLPGVSWASSLLFIEIFRLIERPLSKSEAAVLLWIAAVLPWGWALTFIWRSYYVNSVYATSFGLENKLATLYWWAPKEAWSQRTLIDPSWIIPVGVQLTYLLCALAIEFSLSLILRQIFLKTESLAFPQDAASGNAIISLIERKPKERNIITLAALTGIVYGSLVYAIPSIGSALGYRITVIPILWFDFNTSIHLSFPGASIGIATSLVSILAGFIIPFNVAISTFIGSFAIYFVGNWLLVTNRISQFAAEWVYGMDVSMSYQRSLLYAWMSPLVGIGIAAGIMPLIRRPEILIRSFKSLRGIASGSGTEKPPLPLPTLLLMFLGGAIGSSVLSYYFVRDFGVLLLFLVLTIGWSLCQGMIAARARGITGLGFSIPSVNNLAYLASGYQGVEVWFAPVYAPGGGAASGGTEQLLGAFKTLDMVRCKPMSFIKAWLVALPMVIVLSYVFAQNFWSIAPIPSSYYPSTNVFYPIQALLTSIWVAHPAGILRLDWMGIALVITAIFDVVVSFLHLPISIIGLATGCAMMIPMAFSVFIGGMISKLLQWRLGKDYWSKAAPLFFVGVVIGTGIIIIIGSIVALILKSIWALPF